MHGCVVLLCRNSLLGECHNPVQVVDRTWDQHALPGNVITNKIIPLAIAVDSITTLQDNIFDYIMSSKGVDDLTAKGQHVDGRQIYGLQMGKLVEVVRSIKVLPCWSIFNAHEKKVTSKQMVGNDVIESLEWLEPRVTGQLSGDFAKEFSVSVYSKTTGAASSVKYKWVTKPAASDHLKGIGSRFTADLPVEIDQDYALILGLK